MSKFKIVASSFFLFSVVVSAQNPGKVLEHPCGYSANMQDSALVAFVSEVKVLSDRHPANVALKTLNQSMSQANSSAKKNETIESFFNLNSETEDVKAALANKLAMGDDAASNKEISTLAEILSGTDI